MTWLLLAYCAFNAGSTLWNSTEYGGLSKMVGLATFLLFPFSYSVVTISNRKDLLRALLLGSMIACGTALVVSAAQYHLLEMRAEGGAGNAIPFAFAVSLACSSCLAGSFLQDTKEQRYYLLVSYVAGWGALLYSETRFLWITTIVVNLMIIGVFRRELRHLASRRAALISLAGLVLWGIAGHQLIIERIGELLEDWGAVVGGYGYTTSLGVRYFMATVAIELFADRPILGYGLGATEQLIESAFRQELGQNVRFTHFHNGYLTVLVESGLLGLASLLAVFCVAILIAFRQLKRPIDTTSRAGAALLLILIFTFGIGSLANKIFGHDIQNTLFTFFLVTATYLARGTSTLTEADSGDTRAKQ